jgi:predicted aspartyl protease
MAILAGCGGASRTAGSSDSPAQSPRRPAAAPAQTSLAGDTSVPLTPVEHLMAVSATVNGHGPYRFVIDTGSAAMLHVSSRLASALHLPQVGTVLEGAPGGGMVPVPLVRVGSVTIGGARFDGIEASVGAELGDIRSDGVIGLGLFAQLTATIDFPHRALRLSHAGLPASGAHVVAFTRERGVPQIEVRVGGVSLTADVDTGGPGGLTVPESAALPLRGQPTVVGTGRTTTGEFEIRAATLDGDLDIAGWTRHAPTVDIVAAFPNASIGSAFLRGYILTFDMPDGRLAVTR